MHHQHAAAACVDNNSVRVVTVQRLHRSRASCSCIADIIVGIVSDVITRVLVSSVHVGVGVGFIVIPIPWRQCDRVRPRRFVQQFVTILFVDAKSKWLVTACVYDVSVSPRSTSLLRPIIVTQRTNIFNGAFNIKIVETKKTAAFLFFFLFSWLPQG